MAETASSPRRHYPGPSTAAAAPVDVGGAPISRLARAFAAFVILAPGIIVCVRHPMTAGRHQRPQITDDAYVRGDITPLAPRSRVM